MSKVKSCSVERHSTLDFQTRLGQRFNQPEHIPTDKPWCMQGSYPIPAFPSFRFTSVIIVIRSVRRPSRDDHAISLMSCFAIRSSHSSSIACSSSKGFAHAMTLSCAIALMSVSFHSIFEVVVEVDPPAWGKVFDLQGL